MEPSEEDAIEPPYLFSATPVKGGFVFDKGGTMNLNDFGEGDPFAVDFSGTQTFVPGNFDDPTWYTGKPVGPEAPPTPSAFDDKPISEASFTSPSSWCRDPGRWSAYDAEATEVEVIELVAAMVRAVKPTSVLETGSYRGYMTKAIGDALRRNGSGWLHSVELDSAMAAEATRRCAGLPVTVVCADSLTWRQPAPFDFAWLDSGLYIRQKELRRFSWAPGAIVGVHDVGPQHPVRALLLAEVPSLQPLVLRTPRGVAFYQVQG